MRQLIQAHAYWRLKGLAVDLVIWNEDRAGYRQALQDQILGLVAVGIEAHVIDRPGGIFVRSVEQISEEDRILFQTVARAILSDSRGTLEEQVNRPGAARSARAAPRAQPSRRHDEPPAAFEPPRRDLILANGIGGFTPDGREYVITTTPGQITPAPWVNVLANPSFGSVISESGQAYTWSENAHEFRLTPWHDDPVCDAERRGLLPARRGKRPVLVADAAAQARRDALRQPARLRLQRVRAHRGRHPLGAVGLRGPGRGGQVLACSRCATCPAGRAGFPPPATWNGCWATCGRNRPCT